MGGVSDRWRSIPGGASEKTAEQRREKTCTRTEHYRRVLRALACEVVDRECGADCEKPWSSVHGRLQALFIAFAFSGFLEGTAGFGTPVAIAAAISRDVPIHEYAPLKIKQAITGNGAASKEQVAAMLGKVLHLDAAESVPFLDATDALAAAYCHFLQTSRPQPAAGASTHSWAAFARANADRVSTGRRGAKPISENE